MTEFFDTPHGSRLAFEFVPGHGPGVVFLGGFASDMTGTKATFLSDWGRKSGRAFLRFDYAGHGQSSGTMQDGCISDWARDAAAIITARTSGRQVLVGSSMGGWIMLLLARAMPERVAGLVGVAAAPDFTAALLASMDLAELERLRRTGLGTAVEGDGTMEVWTRLVEDAPAMVLDRPLLLPFPVRLLQGTGDREVPYATGLRLLEHAECPDLRLTLVKGASHRFSEPAQLEMMADAVAEVTRLAVAARGAG